MLLSNQGKKLEKNKKKSRKVVQKSEVKKRISLGRTSSLYKGFHFHIIESSKELGTFSPCSPMVFHPFQKVFYVLSHAFFTFHVMLSISLDVKVFKSFIFIILKLFHLNVLLDASSILSHNITNLTCTYIFWQLYQGESLVIFPFSYILFILFPLLYLVIFLFGH